MCIIKTIKFGISQCGGGGQDVRKVLNDNPIHHLQGWILGGLVVPDLLSGYRLCPGDVTFQI